MRKAESLHSFFCLFLLWICVSGTGMIIGIFKAIKRSRINSIGHIHSLSHLHWFDQIVSTRLWQSQFQWILKKCENLKPKLKSFKPINFKKIFTAKKYLKEHNERFRHCRGLISTNIDWKIKRMLWKGSICTYFLLINNFQINS